MSEGMLNLRDVWYSGYLRFLAEAQERATIVVLSPSHEQRKHPRFPIDEGQFTSATGRPIAVWDMSISGLCFYATESMTPGTVLEICLATVFCTAAEIVACEQLDDPNTPYKVRCRFTDEEQGLQFLTLALELLQLERG